MRNQADISSVPVPAGWRLRRDRSTRIADDGTVVLGGSPLRVLRLSDAGAKVVRAWSAGTPVADRIGERQLARRLLDAGLAHPEPPTAADPAELTVVVPVRDRPAELARCLAVIDRRCTTVVVDDGSDDAEAVGRVARAAGATIVRLEPGRGAAAARNAGLRVVGTPFVAFVDSDCVVGPGFPGRLLDHLADPALGVAVPRIVALEPPGSSVLARYEACWSPLDMGGHECLVRAGSAVPYAPSAAMVARTAALGAGFTEELRVGEDVDLVWRLGEAGWQVRYDPAVTVSHDHRVAWRPWLARRLTYNASAATLARRHPGKVPALTIRPAGAAFWAALALGPPAAAAAAHVLDTAALARSLHGHVPQPLRVASVVVARGRLQESRHVARALTGPWLPFLLAASSVRPRSTRRVWAGIAVAALAEVAAERVPLSAVVPRVVDDVARCAGMWLGCLRERHAGALLPQLRVR